MTTASIGVASSTTEPHLSNFQIPFLPEPVLLPMNRGQTKGELAEMKKERSLRRSRKVPEVRLEDILGGKRCSPLTLKEFEEFLIFHERSVENLQFHAWYLSYRSRFFSLPTQEKSKSPSPGPNYHLLYGTSTASLSGWTGVGKEGERRRSSIWNGLSDIGNAIGRKASSIVGGGRKMPSPGDLTKGDFYRRSSTGEGITDVEMKGIKKEDQPRMSIRTSILASPNVFASSTFGFGPDSPDFRRRGSAPLDNSGRQVKECSIRIPASGTSSRKGSMTTVETGYEDMGRSNASFVTAEDDDRVEDVGYEDQDGTGSASSSIHRNIFDGVNPFANVGAEATRDDVNRGGLVDPFSSPPTRSDPHPSSFFPQSNPLPPSFSRTLSTSKPDRISTRVAAAAPSVSANFLFPSMTSSQQPGTEQGSIEPTHDSTSHLHPKFSSDPPPLPFSSEVTLVISTFLGPLAKKELNLDSRTREGVLATLDFRDGSIPRGTTHPDVFRPIDEAVVAMMQGTSLPSYLRFVGGNINRSKQLFWYAVGLTDLALGLLVSLSVMFFVESRWWRIFGFPFIAIGCMQIYSAFLRICSVVNGREARQLYPWELSEGPIPQISKAVRPPPDPLHRNSDQKVSTSSSSCKDDLEISPSPSAQSYSRNLAPAIPSPLISNSSSEKGDLMSQCPFLFEGTEDEGPTPGTEDGEGPRGWWVGKAGGPGDMGGGGQMRTSKKGHVEGGSRTEGGKAGLRRRRRGRPVLSSMDMPIFGPERAIEDPYILKLHKSTINRVMLVGILCMMIIGAAVLAVPEQGVEGEGILALP